jgi:glucosamine--fructose-6-phosphate aminotransferase (isomerizing)
MALEIAEAPDAVARLLDASADGLKEFRRLVAARKPSYFITSARGSSDHAASYFKYLAEIELGIPCCSIGASVVSIYGAELHLRDTMVITISQSGRSPDILAFQAAAKRAGVPTVAIVNDEDSPLAREGDLCLPLYAGPESSVAATKTYIASATMAAGLVAATGGNGELQRALAQLPDVLSKAMALRWTDVEQAVAAARSLYVLGRGLTLPMAQEAALKLKETAGIHAEAYSAAEVMHGPVELVEEGFPVLVFASRDAAAETTARSVAQVRRAGARIFQPAFQAASHAALDPISMILTFYVSAERIAALRKRNPDAPRLLKKVTRTN